MVILGSTGSIGTQTLEVCEAYNIDVEAISCDKNIDLLNRQIAKFKPKFVCVGDENLRSSVAKIPKERVFVGESGLLDMLELCKSSSVVNALVGFAGLAPSLKAQRLNKTLALANKESLLIGGKFLDTSKINAIDSEHFGLKFLLQNPLKATKLIITASGGAFYKTPIKSLSRATPNDALKHPSWSMGAKITIDSATMANKLFEIMEAYWLYIAPKGQNLSGDSAVLSGCKIDAIIEPSSMIHALVEFSDGSTSAHISKPDMKLAIAHAVLADKNELCLNFSKNIVKHADLLALEKIKFHPINLKKYPIFSLKERVLANPDLGVVINAANEVGVFKFLKKECGFLDISRVVLGAVDKFDEVNIASVDEIFSVDKQVREWANKELKG